MGSFSTNACYAALTSCSKDDFLLAFSRMVASLIQKKRYVNCEISELCEDFASYYGFGIPYHPMQTIMSECEKNGFLTFNKATHKFVPNYEQIDSDGFMDIVAQKNAEYAKIVGNFKKFLIENYSLHSSDEDAEERIQAFIERHGLTMKTNKEILRKVKDDYHFADFLVFCEESGATEIMDYFDEYTIGLSLSEVFSYCEKPETYTNKGTKVYLDTGIVFRLLGIGSADRANSYVGFIRNIQQLGMRVMVYDHTVNELIGIIEGAKHWIGNPEYDATVASETTYYFVSNNWTVDQVGEFSCNLRTTLRDDFNITIDAMSYPRYEDIRVPYEAEIKEMIIDEYRETNSLFSIEEKEHSIDQDAKSIFFTQHKNGNVVPYHINDVKNIFVTHNRSLARVGHTLCRNLVGTNECFIPTVITDVKWGTLLWLNSPASISAINRPRLVSAAYAAFRPTPELTKKLNDALRRLEETGKITPEQCYMMKVSPAAQKLLGKITANDPDRFVDETPLEILKELHQKSFAEGSQSRQTEIDNLNAEKDAMKQELQKMNKENSISKMRDQLAHIESEIKLVNAQIDEYENTVNEYISVKETVNCAVKSRMCWVKGGFTAVSILLIILCIHIGLYCSWLLGVISFIFSICIFIIAIWRNKKITALSMLPFIENRIRTKQNSIRRYSAEKCETAERKLTELKEKLAELELEKEHIQAEIHHLELIAPY